MNWFTQLLDKVLGKRQMRSQLVTLQQTLQERDHEIDVLEKLHSSSYDFNQQKQEANLREIAQLERKLRATEAKLEQERRFVKQLRTESQQKNVSKSRGRHSH